MNRTEALQSLASDRYIVAEGQELTVDFFNPADAPGIARLFYAVYGDGYPIDTFYIPERLAEENRCGSIRSVVARTPAGDVVSHVALYRSSPPNQNLYELGLGLTLPAYRSSRSFFRANLLVTELIGKDGIDGCFGEAVCNHTITQKLSKFVNCIETALEPALMPARAYETEQSADGRVGCMVYFRVDRDIRRRLHIPAVYRAELTFLLDGLSLDRELTVADPAVCGSAGEIDVQRFDYAGVARCTVTTPGEGVTVRLAGLEEEMRRDGYAVVQFFVDLGKSWSGGVVEQLRGQGYSLGGFLPIWFGDDGLLMQKHFTDPGFEGLQILSERGRALADIVRHDWEKAKR